MIQTFTMTPTAGNRIQDVLVDSVSVGSLSTYTMTCSCNGSGTPTIHVNNNNTSTSCVNGTCTTVGGKIVISSVNGTCTTCLNTTCQTISCANGSANVNGVAVTCNNGGCSYDYNVSSGGSSSTSRGSFTCSGGTTTNPFHTIEARFTSNASATLNITIGGQLNAVYLRPTNGIGDSGNRSLYSQNQTQTFYLDVNTRATVSLSGQLNKLYIANALRNQVSYSNLGQLNNVSFF